MNLRRCSCTETVEGLARAFQSVDDIESCDSLGSEERVSNDDSKRKQRRPRIYLSLCVLSVCDGIANDICGGSGSATRRVATTMTTHSRGKS